MFTQPSQCTVRHSLVGRSKVAKVVQCLQYRAQVLMDEENTSKRREKSWKQCDSRLQCCSRGEKMLSVKDLMNSICLLYLKENREII